MKEALSILIPAVLGAVAVFLLLPRPRPYPRLLGVALALLALVLAGVYWVRTDLSIEGVLFYAFSAIAVSAGVGLVTQNNPARAALSFALVVLASCGLFLLQAAPFLMAATIIIYAGAIIVTFLFVLMLARQDTPTDADDRSREPHLACIAGGLLLIALLFVLLRTYDTRTLDALLARAEQASQQDNATAMADALGDNFFDELARELEKARGSRALAQAENRVMNLADDWRQAGQSEPELRKVLDDIRALGTQVRGGWGDLPPDQAIPLSTGSVPSGKLAPPRDVYGKAGTMPAENVAAVGQSLFTDYLLAVELAGMLLTVATIGAIVIAGRKQAGSRVGNQTS